MVETITWLHISDTHFCDKKYGWDCNEIFDSFFEDLEKMKKDYHLYPNLIFFTGDIASGHFNDSSGLSLRDQYKEAEEFLKKIRKIFPKIDILNTFIVPGNHDVNRTLVTDDQTKWLEDLKQNDKINGKNCINELISENRVQWKRYMERLNDYKGFLENNGYNHLLEEPDCLLYSTTRDINNFKVGITGLNSAWSAYGGSEDKANLWFGTYQISRARNKLKDTILSIAIIHHPPNWFTDLEELDINRMIERNFNFYLHGHEHEEWVLEFSSGEHIRIASGALYTGSDKRNGYNFVRLYPSENKGEVFLRQYDNRTGVWIPNIVGNKTDQNGKWELSGLKTTKNKENITVSNNYFPGSYPDNGARYIGYWIQRITDNDTFSYSLISIEYSDQKNSYSLAGIALDNKGQHRATWNSIILGFNHSLEEMYCVYRANVMHAYEITGFSCYVFNKFGGKNYNDGSGYYVDIGAEIKRFYFTFTRVTADIITKLIGDGNIDTPQGRERFIQSYHQLNGDSS